MDSNNIRSISCKMHASVDCKLVSPTTIYDWHKLNSSEIQLWMYVAQYDFFTTRIQSDRLLVHWIPIYNYRHLSSSLGRSHQTPSCSHHEAHTKFWFNQLIRNYGRKVFDPEGFCSPLHFQWTDHPDNMSRWHAAGPTHWPSAVQRQPHPACFHDRLLQGLEFYVFIPDFSY